MGFFKSTSTALEDPQGDAAKLREWCAQMPGIEQISNCCIRDHKRVAGVVESIKLVPREHTCLLQVEIFDGSDRITGIWYGRRKIPGIDLGRRIILEGTMCWLEDSRLQIINPAYELLAA
ncbi:MAG: OB-fold nucleic acid binding domain-containing protein [Actinomycetota bacterium]